MTKKGSLKPTTKHRPSAPRTYENPETGISQPLPPDEDDDDDDDDDDKPESPLAPNNVKVKNKIRDFSLGKLRKIHYVAEKANEAKLVLNQNIVVLAQLRQYYRSLSKRKDFPTDLAESCKDAIDDFELRTDGLENDMQIQIMRLETLLRLLEDRKNLVKQKMQFKQSAKLKKRPAPQYSRVSKHSNEQVFDKEHGHNDQRHE